MCGIFNKKKRKRVKKQEKPLSISKPFPLLLLNFLLMKNGGDFFILQSQNFTQGYTLKLILLVLIAVVQEVAAIMVTVERDLFSF